MNNTYATPMSNRKLPNLGLKTPKEEYDEDGRPLNVLAAQKLILQSGNKTMYCQQKTFDSPKHAMEKLEQSKQRISELLSQARHTQVGHFKSSLYEVCETDYKVANMPRIRVLPKYVENTPAFGNFPG